MANVALILRKSKLVQTNTARTPDKKLEETSLGFQAWFPYNRSDLPDRPSRFETIGTITGFHMIEATAAIMIAWIEQRSIQVFAPNFS